MLDWLVGYEDSLVNGLGGKCSYEGSLVRLIINNFYLHFTFSIRVNCMNT